MHRSLKPFAFSAIRRFPARPIRGQSCSCMSTGSHAIATEQSVDLAAQSGCHHIPFQHFGAEPSRQGNELTAPSLPSNCFNDGLYRENDDDAAAAHLLTLLQTQHRLNPRSGLAEQWQSLKLTGRQLPTQGVLANEIWRLLLQDVSLHDDLFNHAIAIRAKSGLLLDRFYEFLMIRLFARVVASDAEHALVLAWHNKLLHQYFIRPGSLNELTIAAKASRSNLRLLRQLYHREACLPKQGIYDLIVPELCACKEWRLALDWHFFLYTQADFPRASSFFKTIFHRQPSLEEALMEFLPALPCEKARVKPGRTQAWSQTDGHMTALLPGDQFSPLSLDGTDSSYSQAPLGDHFCARLLATEGKPILLAVKALAMFNDRELGPLALRELMARAQSLHQATGYLQIFVDAGITIGSSMYSRVVKHFLATKQWDLLTDLVQSDLHPDIILDYSLQQHLLKYYDAKGEHLSSRRTLEILKLIEIDSSKPKFFIDPVSGQPVSSVAGVQPTALDKRLQIIAFTEGRAELQILLDDMIVQSVPLSSRALAFMANSLFSSEKATSCWKRFGPNICIRLLKSGHYLTHDLWTKAIELLGSVGRESDIYVLFSFFIRQYYNKRVTAERSNSLGQDRDRISSAIEEMASYLSESEPDSHAAKFCLHQLTGSIVALSFKTAIPRLLPRKKQAPDSPAPVFLAGLRFLSQLRIQGFEPDRIVIRNTLRKLVLQMYGSQASRMRSNIVINRHNPFTLEELLFCIEQVWSGPRLFPELYNNPDVQTICCHDGPKSTISAEASKEPVKSAGAAAAVSASTSTLPIDIHHDPALSSWKSSDFRTLSAQYGGSILDDLLTTTASPTASKFLTVRDRIQHRIQLRHLILGHTPDCKTVDMHDMPISYKRWDAFIRNSAIMADRILVQRGLCIPLPDADSNLNDDTCPITHLTTCP